MFTCTVCVCVCAYLHIFSVRWWWGIFACIYWGVGNGDVNVLCVCVHGWVFQYICGCVCGCVLLLYELRAFCRCRKGEYADSE